MNWELNKLSEFGNCKNGLNFDSKRNECNIKCLGVGDFKNLTTIRNIELLQTITIEKKPAKEYLLQNGDIIFVLEQEAFETPELNHKNKMSLENEYAIDHLFSEKF